MNIRFFSENLSVDDEVIKNTIAMGKDNEAPDWEFRIARHENFILGG